jgi:hypothetical protein
MTASFHGVASWRHPSAQLSDVESYVMLLAQCVDSGVLTVNQLKVAAAASARRTARHVPRSFQSGWDRAAEYVKEYDLDVPGAARRFAALQHLIDQLSFPTGLDSVRTLPAEKSP